jgi:hypothetical protein
MIKINSLPNRPLNIVETDRLVESGMFAPLTLTLGIEKDDLPQAENIETPEDLDLLDHPESITMQTYSLMHLTPEGGAVSVGFSEQDQEWQIAVEMSQDEFKHDVFEEATHRYVKERTTREIGYDGMISVFDND